MWKPAVFAVMGILFGVAIALIASHASERASVAANATPFAKAPTIDTAAIDISDLQRQLNELRQAILARPVASGIQPSVSSEPAQPPETPPAQEKDPVLEHHKALGEYAQEGTDPSWAPATERSILTDLKTTASEGGFDVKSVTCRTTMCVADIQFTTFGDAQRRWSSLLATRNASRCGFEVVLDGTPADPAAPYSTQMLFNCEKVRSGEY